MIQRSWPTVAILVIASTVVAQPKTADDYEADGKAAFRAGRFRDALSSFREAYRLDPLAVRALQVATAAPYATKLSAAITDLKHWLILKRADAQAAGDLEFSWTLLDTIMSSFQTRAEQLERVQITEVNVWKKKVEDLADNVNRLQLENARLQRIRPIRPP